MLHKIRAPLAAASLIFTTACATTLPARADDPIEKAGVAVGLTAGNMVAIPAKAISMVMGAGIWRRIIRADRRQCGPDETDLAGYHSGPVPDHA